MQDTHPTEQELKDFVQFHLTVDQAHHLGQHLQVCAECNSHYREAYKDKPGAPAVPEIEKALLPS